MEKIKEVEFQVCELCEKSFSNETLMMRHKKEVHGSQNDSFCKLCKKRFSRKHVLKRHLDTVHKRIKKFECNFCGRHFSMKENMLRHAQTHEVESQDTKKYKCLTCDRTYSSNTSLVRHVKEMSDEFIGDFIPFDIIINLIGKEVKEKTITSK